MIGLMLVMALVSAIILIAVLNSKRSGTGSRQPSKPDLDHAAQGFVAVALMRRNRIEIDLESVEFGEVQRQLAEGCTAHQGLSSRWGSAVARTADLRLFQAGIEAFEQVQREHEKSDDPREKFYSAAKLYLAHQLAEAPRDFQNFLTHVRG